MSETIRRSFTLVALMLLPLLATPPAGAYHGDPDREDFPGQQERVEREREQRERAERERAEQGEGIGAGGATVWSIAPATTDDGTGPVSIRVEVEPGGSVTDAVTVTNFGSEAARFVVYASDGVVTDGGEFDVLPASIPPSAAGAWVSLGEGGPGEPLTVEIEAESEVTVPFEIDVPAQATPGDHPAGIVASLAGESVGVGLESRVGTRIHLRVAGEVEPALAVQDVSASYEASWNPMTPGTLHLEYRVVNEGNVRLGDQSEAFGAGLLGWGERSNPGTAHREILPGQEALSALTLENVWPLLRYSGEVRTVPVVVGEDVIDVALAPGATAWTAWTVPWLHVAALVVAVGALILWRRRRRRRETRTQARIDAAVAQAREEARPG